MKVKDKETQAVKVSEPVPKGPKDGEQDVPTPKQLPQQDKKRVAVELPELPQDWAQTDCITPEQQEPPKKRGRKPKTQEPAHDGKKPKSEPKKGACKNKKGLTNADTSTEATAKTVEPNAADTVEAGAKKPSTRTAKATKLAAAVPKAKARRSKKQHDTTTVPSASSALEVLPVPKKQRSKAKKLTGKEAPPPSSYESMETNEECNSFDAYAVAAANCDVNNLQDKTEETKEASSKPVKDSETKKRLSRKSCAYKKARTLALKAGKSMAEATVAAKKVASLAIACFIIYACRAKYNYQSCRQNIYRSNNL